MPRKVTAWACSWGCGAKVQTHKQRMVAHEEKCLRNPARRACITCIHDGVESCIDNYGVEYASPFCGLDKRGERLCIYDCEHWEGDLG